MIAKWIHKTTGMLQPMTPSRVWLWLALCLLIGALTPAAVAAQDSSGVSQQAGGTASTALIAQTATYRYAGQPDRTTEVQRSRDAGLTWLAAGTIPEPVAQLAVNPAMTA